MRTVGASGESAWLMAKVDSGTPPNGHDQRASSARTSPPGSEPPAFVRRARHGRQSVEPVHGDLNGVAGRREVDHPDCGHAEPRLPRPTPARSERAPPDRRSTGRGWRRPRTPAATSPTAGPRAPGGVPPPRPRPRPASSSRALVSRPSAGPSSENGSSGGASLANAGRDAEPAVGGARDHDSWCSPAESPLDAAHRRR